MIFQSWVCRGPAAAIRLRLIARRQTRLRFRGRTGRRLGHCRYGRNAWLLEHRSKIKPSSSLGAVTSQRCSPHSYLQPGRSPRLPHAELRMPQANGTRFQRSQSTAALTDVPPIAGSSWVPLYGARRHVSVFESGGENGVAGVPPTGPRLVAKRTAKT